jgi:hypothetical protein
VHNDRIYDAAMFEISQISDGFLRAYTGKRKIIMCEHGRIPTRLRRACWRGCAQNTVGVKFGTTEGKVPIIYQSTARVNTKQVRNRHYKGV